MKKVFSILIAMSLMLTLCSCATQNDSAPAPGSSGNRADGNSPRPAQNNQDSAPTSSPNQGNPNQDNPGNPDASTLMLTVEQAMDLLYNYVDAELFHPGELDKWEGETLFYCFVYDDGDNEYRYAYVNSMTGEIEFADEIVNYTGEDVIDPWSDPGDSGRLEWWGIYAKTDDTGFVFEINQVGVNEYWIDIIQVREPNDVDYIRNLTSLSEIGDAIDYNVITYGWAEIDRDNAYFAMLSDIGLSLYEDYSAIDLFAGESTEWAYMRGQYVKLS